MLYSCWLIFFWTCVILPQNQWVKEMLFSIDAFDPGKRSKGKSFDLSLSTQISPVLFVHLNMHLFDRWVKLGMMIACDILAPFLVSTENIWRVTWISCVWCQRVILPPGWLSFPIVEFPLFRHRLSGARKSTQGAIGEARGDLGKVQWLTGWLVLPCFTYIWVVLLVNIGKLY